MGSFQQICLGAICLFAAFMFGNYVNNNPPLHSDAQNLVGGISQTISGLASNATEIGATAAGNIESRLPISGFAPIENKPAPIVTMKTPLRSRFAIPSAQTASPAFELGGSNGSQTTNPLPPPSQLAETIRQPGPGFLDRPFSSSPLEPAALKPAIQVPDFSAIAAEFKNTPIELPNMSRLGGMPSHSNSNQTQSNQFGNWQHANPDNQRLKQLVQRLPDNDFRNPNFQSGQRDNLTWQQPQPPQQQQQFQPNTQEEFTVPSQDFAPQGFSQADFEPKLNDDIFGLKPQPNRYEDLREHNNERFEAVSNRRPERNFDRQSSGYDYDVPPPGPEEDYDFDDRNSSGFRGNLTFRPQLENRSGNSRNDLREDRELAPAVPIDYQTQMQSHYPPEPPQRFDNRTQSQSGRLPFRLTDQAKTELVQLRDRADSMIGLESTNFVDHTIQDGETLQTISARYFGSPNYYLDIYLANRNKLRNPADTQAGVSIRVPVYQSP